MKKKNIKYIVLFVLAICLIIALVIWRYCPPMPDASASTTDTTTEITVDTNPESSGTVPGSEPGGTEDGAQPTDQVTEPSGEVTEPSEPSGDGTEPTTHPSDPADPTEPSEPTDPGTEPTEPTDPVTEPTEPVEDPTNPAPTEPEPTEPDPTEPTEPPHSHDFSSVVKAPTCTEKGYTTYTCKTCGYSYKGNETAAKGHSYSKVSTKEPTCTEKGYSTYKCDACGHSYNGDEKGAKGHSYSSKVVKATCSEKGYTLYTCAACGDSYKDNYTEASGEHNYGEWMVVHGMLVRDCTDCYYSEYPNDANTSDLASAATEFEAAVAEVIFKYINQFRAEENSTKLEWLPGMSQVAQYRSRQLVTNFAHDVDDMREAAAYYEYGEWLDPSQFGDPDGEGYYRTNSQEAIGYFDLNGFTGTYTVDELGYRIASGYRNSAGHWSYLSSSEYSFSAVGVTWANGIMYHCVMVGSVNYG